MDAWFSVNVFVDPASGRTSHTVKGRSMCKFGRLAVWQSQQALAMGSLQYLMKLCVILTVVTH